MRNKIWMTGVAALLGTVAVLGQPSLAQSVGVNSQPGQHRGMGKLKKLAEELGLTSDQKAQIRPILKNTVQQVRAVRANTSLTPAQEKTQIKEIRKESRQQIMAILTPDQRAQLRQIRRSRKNASGA